MQWPIGLYCDYNSILKEKNKSIPVVYQWFNNAALLNKNIARLNILHLKSMAYSACFIIFVVQSCNLNAIPCEHCYSFY